jgi:glycosyltransferase involved in cell wall biosynthesis
VRLFWVERQGRLIRDFDQRATIRARHRHPARHCLENRQSEALVEQGYGLIVVESAARGVPSVVVAGPDNAATELVDEGANGFVSPSVEADDLAAALVRVYDAGPELRRSTLEWFRRNAERLSLERSLHTVLRQYASADS